jgi:hypothetical protein
MKKVMLIGMLAVAIASSASGANLLVNPGFETGDETGWTKWGAPWGPSPTAVVSPGYLSNYASEHGTGGSHGLFQAVAVPVGTVVTVDAMWKGSSINWTEVMLWTQAAPGGEATRADTGAAADIAFKRDNFGMNPPNTWDWQLASLSPHPSGNGGTVISAGYVVVATKNGNAGTAWFDNIVLTPEPAAALLLGLPLLLVRRRRA